jgi:hypothetical protein
MDNDAAPNNRIAADGIKTLVEMQKLLAAAEHERYMSSPSVEFLARTDSIACFNLFCKMQNHNISLFNSLSDFGG